MFSAVLRSSQRYSRIISGLSKDFSNDSNKSIKDSLKSTSTDLPTLLNNLDDSNRTKYALNINLANECQLIPFSI